MTKKQRVLITGGAGFLGLHLAHRFHEQKWQVRLVDIAPYPQNEYPAGVETLTADVRDVAAMRSAMKQVDVVVHAAAALPLWPKSEIMSTNVTGTQVVLAAAAQAKVQRVIYISSTAVYGVPIKHPIEETDALVGVGPYGESKIGAEAACQHALKKGLAVTILRPKTFVGTQRLGVFEILFDWIHDGKPIPVIGNGRNRYQLLDVDDLVSAILLIAQSQKTQLNSAFNIGARQFTTVRQDLEAVFAAAKSGSRIMTTPAAPIKLVLRTLELLHLSPLYRWVYDTADKDSFVSIDKLTKALNWQPKFSNAQALIKSFRWYQVHYAEIKSRQSGVTHTVGWKQGALGLIKKFL